MFRRNGLKLRKIKINLKQNGAIQASKQEEKAGKAQKADQMGAFLDSSKNIRKDKEGPPRQAHKAEKKLEKDKDKGINRVIQPICHLSQKN